MTTDMMVVFFLLGLAIFLFVTDLLRVDLVGLLMMVLLPLTGVLSAEQAIAGLSSNAVVSIIAVMIIGAGLNKTGIMNEVAAQIIKVVGHSENRILAVISLTVAFISSFMQNIGAAALFMPAAIRVSRQLNFSPSRVLMPMGFCAIIGGCLTLVGSSPLIMLNDLMQGWWANNQSAVHNQTFVPFKLFKVTPIGIALLVSSILYFIFLGKRLLPSTSVELQEGNADKRLQEIYGEEVGRSYELSVPAFFPSHTLGELEIRPKYHVTIVGIAKNNGYQKELAPTKDSLIEAGDILWVISAEKNISRLAEEQGWVVKEEHEVFAEENYPDESGIVEGVVIPHSNLSQHTMEELQFRHLFQVNPLAIVRGDLIIMDAINVTELQQGDTILMQGRWKQFRLLADQMDIVIINDIPGEELKPERKRCAVFFLLMALTLALGFEVKLSIALLTGALGMILTKIIPADRAYEAVDWRTVFLLSGLIPLGTAFEITGTAAFIAEKTLAAVGTPGPLLLLLVIALLTSSFSLVASNVGAVVLMVPLAMTMASTIGADPMVAALVVAVSASNTFILPTHQVNALIMRAGNYRTMDYIRTGLGMSVIFVGVLMLCVKFMFL
ncbi:MAG: anion permease [Proteobacteria bacterium]|nr:anion permease [Pseudomonadota bacterium]